MSVRNNDIASLIEKYPFWFPVPLSALRRLSLRQAQPDGQDSQVAMGTDMENFIKKKVEVCKVLLSAGKQTAELGF